MALIAAEKNPNNSVIFTTAGVDDTAYNVLLHGDKGNGNYDHWYAGAKVNLDFVRSCGYVCAGAAVKSLEETRNGDSEPGPYHKQWGKDSMQNASSVMIKPDSGLAVTIIGNKECNYDKTSQIEAECTSGTHHSTNYKYRVQKNCNHTNWTWDPDCTEPVDRMYYPKFPAHGGYYANSVLRQNQLRECNVASGSVNFDEPVGPNGKDCRKMCLRTQNGQYVNERECAAAVERYCKGRLAQDIDISKDKDDLCKREPKLTEYYDTYCTTDEGIQKRVCKEHCGRNDKWEHCKNTIFRYCKGNTLKSDVWCKETLANIKAHGENKVYMTEFCNGEGADMPLCSCLNTEKIKADITKIPNITPVVVTAMVTEPTCYYQPCSGGATYQLTKNHQCKPLYVCQNIIENLNIVGNSNMIKQSNDCGPDNSTAANKTGPSAADATKGTAPSGVNKGTTTTTTSTSGTSDQTDPAEQAEPEGIWEYIKSKAAYFGIGAGFLVCLCMMCCIACFCLLLMMSSKGGSRRR